VSRNYFVVVEGDTYAAMQFTDACGLTPEDVAVRAFLEAPHDPEQPWACYTHRCGPANDRYEINFAVCTTPIMGRLVYDTMSRDFVDYDAHKHRTALLADARRVHVALKAGSAGACVWDKLEFRKKKAVAK